MSRNRDRLALSSVGHGGTGNGYDTKFRKWYLKSVGDYLPQSPAANESNVSK
jgi:hypothetical protein